MSCSGRWTAPWWQQLSFSPLQLLALQYGHSNTIRPRKCRSGGARSTMSSSSQNIACMRRRAVKFAALALQRLPIAWLLRQSGHMDWQSPLCWCPHLKQGHAWFRIWSPPQNRHMWGWPWILAASMSRLVSLRHAVSMGWSPKQCRQTFAITAWFWLMIDMSTFELEQAKSIGWSP